MNRTNTPKQKSDPDKTHPQHNHRNPVHRLRPTSSACILQVAKRFVGGFLDGLNPLENLTNEMMKTEKDSVRSLREQKKVFMAKNVVNRYNNDAIF
ncbi:uncharacterized protein DS421_11g342950 [Arachis hypogaea]|nr:uncharacterized protein DS421_11g342950 [Arachis hypogaea]